MSIDAAEIIGALMTPAGREDPYPLYARAHALGPTASIGGGPVMVQGYDAVNQVLRNPAFGVADVEMRRSWDPEHNARTSIESLSRSILEANAPAHGRMRSLISSVFTPRRVATLEPTIVAAVERLLNWLAVLGADGVNSTDDAAHGKPVDFVEEFAVRLPLTVICELLGIPQGDRHLFRPLASELAKSLELTLDASELDSADDAAEELHAYFAALAAERRADPRDDLVSALVQARDADDGSLSDAELLSNLTLLLIAGFETTTNLLGNGLALLFEHPDVARDLRSGEIPVTAFVDEVLRHDSPVQLTSRLALADGLEIAGRPVPRYGEVVVLIGAANRDPNRYADPDRFDPRRQDISPLSFGAGAHYCLGAVLARLEATTAFPRLLSRFPDLAPAPGATPVRRGRLVLRGYETLPVTVC